MAAISWRPTGVLFAVGVGGSEPLEGWVGVDAVLAADFGGDGAVHGVDLRAQPVQHGRKFAVS